MSAQFPSVHHLLRWLDSEPCHPIHEPSVEHQREVGYGDTWVQPNGPNLHFVEYGAVPEIAQVASLALSLEGATSEAAQEVVAKVRKLSMRGFLISRVYSRFNTDGVWMLRHRSHVWPIAEDDWAEAQRHGFEPRNTPGDALARAYAEMIRCLADPVCGEVNGSGTAKCTKPPHAEHEQHHDRNRQIMWRNIVIHPSPKEQEA